MILKYGRQYSSIGLLMIIIFSLLLTGCASEADYKKESVMVNYEELARKPESYKGQKLVINGNIRNIKQNGKEVELLFLNGQTPIIAKYTMKDNEERFLANDFVRVYCEFQQVSSKKDSVMLSETTVLEMNAKYLERPVWAFLKSGLDINRWTIKSDGNASPLDFESMQISLSGKGVNKDNLEIDGLIMLKSAYFKFKGIIDDAGVGTIEFIDSKGNPKGLQGKIKIVNKSEIQIEVPSMTEAAVSISGNRNVDINAGTYVLIRK